MGGGYFDYQDKNLKNDMFGFDHEHKNPLEDREISNLIFDVLTLLNVFDYYKSGDTGEENYIKSKTEFKKKWLHNKNYQKEVLEQIINDTLQDTKDELLKMLWEARK